MKKGDFIDVVKHDLGFSIESWAKGSIEDIYGNGSTNLGDESCDTVKKFNINYWKDAAAGSKIFRADSLQISKLNSKIPGECWRVGL